MLINTIKPYQLDLIIWIFYYTFVVISIPWYWFTNIPKCARFAILQSLTLDFVASRGPKRNLPVLPLKAMKQTPMHQVYKWCGKQYEQVGILISTNQVLQI